MEGYTEKKYERIQQTSEVAAEIIIPMLLKYVQPKSAIDYGCGTGAWLSVLKNYGVERVLGVDGPWVKKEYLSITEDEFLAYDINLPFKTENQYDLCLCLEVVEHIPSENMEVFFDSLVDLAPVILFSAPVPGQGGVGTELFQFQWPEYWAEKFRSKGFVSIDCIRKKIWNNDNVIYWFKQNIILFVKEELLEQNPDLKAAYNQYGGIPKPLVHPDSHPTFLRSVQKSISRKLSRITNIFS